MTLDLLLIALVITLEPLPLVSFLLILGSERGVRKGAAFIFGWLVSLAIMIAVTVLITGNNPPRAKTAPSLGVVIVKLLLGVGLVVVAVRRRRRVGQPREAKKPPRWQTGIDSMSMWFAMAVGILIQPWGLVAAGVTIIVNAKLTTWESYLSLILFCVVATSTIAALELFAAFKPEVAESVNIRIRAWIERNTDQAIVILSLVAGFFLIGSSISYFVT